MTASKNSSNQTKALTLNTTQKHHEKLHMCLVCGAGPFCSDHIGQHFTPCFDAHCPVSSSNNKSIPKSLPHGPTKCHARVFGHGFKVATPAPSWNQPEHCIPKYTFNLDVY
ncbi:Aste57867_9818 [Aphanomyces stellatus]|uniref:Aste57867_9818 protein n=1 Tax=Aphanomyces stellatus TaxID=120398 RepID=A0A485KP51_9STRA|nr:hypothetical protein As57867_009779 [Aphanomyces stellatus]VFT86697.1 Aste57867_9818 [Aphanomyces stellatus]